MGISKSYLKELAKNKKFGQKGYKELPNDQNVRIPVTGALKGTKEFYTSFMNSPRYQQMLEGKTFNPYGTFKGVSSDYIRDARLRNLQGSKDDIYTFGNPKDWKTYTGNTDDILGFSKSTSGAIYLNPLFYNKPQPETFEDSELRRETLSHEFSHSIDRPLPYTGIRLIPEEDIYEIKDRTLANQREFLKKKGNKRSTWEYLTEPTEIRARINSVRERLWKNGIDIGKKEITAEDIKDINTENLKDLRDVLKEEDIIWMLNNISKTESPQKEKYAQSGAYISTQGYKRNSPDVNNPYNVIPSNQITMKGVDFPVMGTDNMGYQQMMYPGQDYTFPGDYVTEFPLKNMGNKRYGQVGFYKPDFRSKSQIAAAQGQQREYTNVPTQRTPTEAKAIREKQLAELKRKTVGTIRETTDADREAQNRQALTFAGNAEKRGASSPLNDILDIVNPFSYYYAGKDVGKGLGETAKGIYNVDPNQIGAGITQAAFGALGVLPAAAELKPALKGAGKYLTQSPLRNAFKKLPGSSSKFKSEIDWGKWNADTPKYPELMNEYNAIEESTKKAGTWMKNPDGSSFQGTPEQFVQQNSQNFKKAFPEFQTTFRGKRDFDPAPQGKILFTTDDKQLAAKYGSHGQTDLPATEFYHPDKNILGYNDQGGLYEFYHRPSGLKIDAKGSKWYNIENAPYRKIMEKTIPEQVENWDYWRSSNQGLDKGNYLSTDEFASYIKNNKIPSFEINNVFDGSNIPSTIKGFNTNVFPIKSRWYNNGMFDMTNPNIYKGLIPAGLGLGAVQQYLQNKPKGTYQSGGNVNDASYMNFVRTLPPNLAQPNDPSYNLRGYWNALGNPESFDYNQPTDPQGYYHAFSRDPRTGQILKAPFHPSFKEGVSDKGAYKLVNPKGDVYTQGFKYPAYEGYYGLPKNAIIDNNYDFLDKPNYEGYFQMGGTMSVPGVNGQIVSSGPQPLTSVKKTRGPITKNKKGDIKTMSNQQVKQVLKYSKQKPNKI
jgi:hypothetical protein